MDDYILSILIILPNFVNCYKEELKTNHHQNKYSFNREFSETFRRTIYEFGNMF